MARLKQAPVYWREMRRQAEEWCQKCHLCGSKKSPPRPEKAPLRQYLVGAPMERIAIDLTGPLPRTKAGNTSIMVVADYFTKWVEAGLFRGVCRLLGIHRTRTTPFYPNPTAWSNGSTGL